MTQASQKNSQPTAPCLVLMFKAPARSKRRLAAHIGPLAATLAEHLCACALEDLATWPGPVCFAPATDGDLLWLRARVGSQPRIVTQHGANLGERINHVGTTLRAAGFARQLFIGIDCPAIDAAYLLRAAGLLDTHDAVFGPARDGGVVLMATRRPWPELGPLSWSETVLGVELERLCEQHGFTTAALPTLADVDTLADLAELEHGLARDRRPARRALLSWLAAEREALRLKRA